MKLANGAGQIGEGVDGQGARVLVSGASFAGLATAYWMNRLGYRVTVVEVAAGLKMGGTPVDIREGTVEIARRMGLLERIQELSLHGRPMEFVGRDGTRVAGMEAHPEDERARRGGYEIERNTLLQMLFDAVSEEVEFLFGDRIARLEEFAEEVKVTFESGAEGHFALVLGCDGIHSAVRRMCFGEESAYTVFMQNYFALSIVDTLLIEEDRSMMYNLPGRTVMLNAYRGKTDIAFCFFSEREVAYDYRDQEEQRRMIREQFVDAGWRTAELLEEMDGCGNFYFDKLCQIRMPSWTKGRVGLVGDAAYCASPTAGMGGSLAIVGAAALGDAFAKHPGDVAAAFAEYDASLRPLIERVQAEAIGFGLAMFAPRTEEAIQARNARLNEGL
jgi:2-polyprenyl-6-methoxyphenol hydroxylase-like FAD-dependent oxidoreductase